MHAIVFLISFSLSTNKVCDKVRLYQKQKFVSGVVYDLMHSQTMNTVNPKWICTHIDQ